MTALSGGEQLDDGPIPMNSVLERPDAVAGDARHAPRSLDEIFPLRGDASRGRQMQETWRAFGSEMEGAVRAALDASRSPPEIAYAIGEIVHNYFRTRGVTLTSYELRRLVAELLALQDRAAIAGRPPASPLVTFAGEPASAETAWTGDETAARRDPSCPTSCSKARRRGWSTVTPRDRDAALLADGDGQGAARGLRSMPRSRPRATAASRAIDAVLGEVFQGEPQRRERLARLALSELCGLGPDRPAVGRPVDPRACS